MAMEFIIIATQGTGEIDCKAISLIGEGIKNESSPVV